MNPLYSFYNNIPEREAVKLFLTESLKEIAIDKAFKGESTDGIIHAYKALEGAFSKLDEIYGVKEEKTIPSAR